MKNLASSKGVTDDFLKIQFYKRVNLHTCEVFKFFAVFIFVSVQIVMSFLGTSSSSFLWHFTSFQELLLDSFLILCYDQMFILYIFCPRLVIHHFSKEHQFLLVGNGIQKLESGYQRCSLLMDCSLSAGLCSGQSQKIGFSF